MALGLSSDLLQWNGKRGGIFFLAQDSKHEHDSNFDARTSFLIMRWRGHVNPCFNRTVKQSGKIVVSALTKNLDED